MRFAFALFTHFPHGGLTRDAIAIARVCIARGHQVRLFAGECRGEVPSDIDLRLLPLKATGNHAKAREFAARLPDAVAKFNPHLLFGFNKMPGLDAYYTADVCLAEDLRERSWWHAITPRNRQYLAFEKAVFARDATTRILMLADTQRKLYQAHYATPDSRIAMLPPGIARDRVAGDDAAMRRKNLRARLRFAEDDKLLLAIGSGFRTKGLDRSIAALASLPESMRAHLLAVGDDKSAHYERMARKLKVDARVHFFGGRDDAAEFLLASDVLLHPARRENTGTVILEAMVAGLPVVASDVCGYASYVREADMGEVVASPFSQGALNAAVQKVLAADADSWRARGAVFANTVDIYELPLHAANKLEEIALLLTAPC